MAGTDVRECICCGAEDDCVEGLCLNCSAYGHKQQKTADLLTLGLLEEKRKNSDLVGLLNHIKTELESSRKKNKQGCSFPYLTAESICSKIENTLKSTKN